MTAATAGDVLDYWFGAPGTAGHGPTRPLWFTKSADTDEEIRSRFGATVETALRGDLDGWADGGAGGALALIVVLDQFTRNVHRDSARAFAGDARALALARRLVEAGADRELPPLQRWFAYLPFEHSEDLADQRESLRLFGELAQEGLAEPLVWAQKHYDVVARFGRYPHRNELLGRPSTPAEIEFLRQPGSRF
jgi:uncharacterized protein (DUF924 family)